MNNKKGAIAFVRGDDAKRTAEPYLFHNGQWSPVRGHQIFDTIEASGDAWAPKGSADWMLEFSTLVAQGYTARGVFDHVSELKLQQYKAA